MGACLSCHAATAAEDSSSKVIMENGELKEFIGGVRAGVVLGKSGAFFVCNSDDMEFEDCLTAVGEAEELQPGQLYFVLPLSMMKRKLQLEELAALAVKASAALVRAGAAAAVTGVREGKNGGAGEEYERKSVQERGFSIGSTGRQMRRAEKGRPSGRHFRSELSTIQE